ncbi:hypothetical protein CPB86DRAFT_358178 [Serendipita vermifera]|nr:hypothetical protein CPB86DRAFT_358178 [Serendipita vermifera]
MYFSPRQVANRGPSRTFLAADKAPAWPSRAAHLLQLDLHHVADLDKMVPKRCQNVVNKVSVAIPILTSATTPLGPNPTPRRTKRSPIFTPFSPLPGLCLAPELDVAPPPV